MSRQRWYAPITSIYELNVRVDISSATSATRDNGVRNDRYRLITLLDGPIGSENEAQGDVCFLQQRVGSRDGIKRASLIRVVRICDG